MQPAGNYDTSVELGETNVKPLDDLSCFLDVDMGYGLGGVASTEWLSESLKWSNPTRVSPAKPKLSRR